MVLLGIAIAPCKIIYATIPLLALAIPTNRFSLKKNSLAFKITLVVCIFLSIVVARLGSIEPPVAVSDLDMRGTESGHFYNVSFAFENPFAFLALIARTLDAIFDFYLQSLAGGSLGWFQANLILPSFYLIPVLLLALLGSQEQRPDVSAPSIPRWMLLTAAFVSIAGSVASMWISWTFDTEGVIQGVQGRYFLPVLPLILLALKTRFIDVNRDLKTFTIGFLVCFNVLYLVRIAAMIYLI